MANLKRGEVKIRLLAAAAVHRNVEAAARSLDVSPDHLEALRHDDPRWSERIDAVAAFDPSRVEPFEAFRLRCFGHRTPAHHRRIIRVLHEAQPGSISLVLAFPQAGKTTLLIDWYCWRLAFDPNYRIAVISESQDLSRKIIAQVATRMTDEFAAGEFLRSFGPFQSPDRSKPWNADFLQVLRSNHDEKEPSLEARGAGSSLYGGRYDKIVGDDIQSDKTVNDTPKLLRYIRQTVLTRPDDTRGSVTFIGSRVDPDDIYRRMLDEHMIDHFESIPALDQPVSAEEHFTARRVPGKGWVVDVNPDCPARPTWGERTTLEALAKRRHQVKEEIWARTYMQAQVGTGGAVFTSDEVDACKDTTRRLGRRGLGVDCVLSIDPALDTGVCAFLVLAYSRDRLWCIDARERTDVHRYEDIYDTAGDFAMRYRPSTVIVEQNNFQKGLHLDDRMLALAAKYRFELFPHQTHRQKNDPLIGVKAMASAFVDQEVSIPWGDDEARAAMGPLVTQLVSWRPQRRQKADSVMALWFGWLWWEQVRRSLGVPNVIRRNVPSWVRRVPA